MGAKTSQGYKSSYTGDQIDLSVGRVLEGNYIEKTFSELIQLITKNQLIPGVNYCMTDYSEKFGLIITALSNNKLSSIAFPNKKLENIYNVYFEYDISSIITNQLITVNKGLITKTFIGSNEFPFDIFNIDTNKVKINLLNINNCIIKNIPKNSNKFEISNSSNILIMPGCYNLKINGLTNSIIMPNIHDVELSDIHSNSIISYDELSDTIIIAKN